MASKNMLNNQFMKYRRRFFITRLVFHLLLMGLVGTGLLFIFSYLFLPVFTHQGQSITVPNLIGSSLTEVEVVLDQQRLRSEITDETAYIPEYAPMTVLQQHPKPGTQVKRWRKIYLTINSPTPPEVPMPNLVDGSLRNAQTRLQNQGLLLGTIRYVSDIAEDAVLEQYHEKVKIAPGTLLGKGSKIDLLVGAGLSKTQVTVPEILGMRLVDAKRLLLNKGVKIGRVTYSENSEEEVLPGTIFKQMPLAGQRVYKGESIDLWMAELPEEPEEGMLLLPGRDD